MLVLVGAAAAVFFLRHQATFNSEPAATSAAGAEPSLTSDADGARISAEPDVPTANGRVESPEIAGMERTGASSESIDVEEEEVVRIPIPVELESWFGSDPSMLEFHENLEREPRDPEWAQQLEAEFRDFINSRPNLLDIKVLSVECRSSSCEILAVGYGDDSFRMWLTEMSELFVEDTWLKERFGEGPGEAGCGGGNIVPGVMGLNCEFRSGEPEVAAIDTAEESSTEFLIAESPEAESNAGNRIPVPQGMVALLETDGDLTDLHLRMEGEPTDHSWSVYMEDQMTEYLLSRPALDSSSIVLVECRTTLCQIQVIMEDGSSMVDWVLEIPEFFRQSWHDLVPAGANGDELASGATGLIWMLERRSPEQRGPG